jgi:hypothetical protein
MGTKVLVHLKPNQRPSWAYHGTEGWYVGPSMEHYRCVKCYLPSSGRERDIDTLELFPKQIPFPQVTTNDYLQQAAADIISILTTKPSITPSLAYNDETKNALFKIAQLLGWSALPPTAPDIPSPLPRVPTLPTVPPSPTVVRRLIPDTSSKVQQLSQPAPHKPTSSPRVVPFRQPTVPLRRSPRHHQLAQHTPVLTTFQHHVQHTYNKDGVKETIDTLLAGPNGAIWAGSLNNEFGRLAQGYGTIIGTNTIDFIPKHEVPPITKSPTGTSSAIFARSKPSNIVSV